MKTKIVLKGLNYLQRTILVHVGYFRKFISFGSLLPAFPLPTAINNHPMNYKSSFNLRHSDRIEEEDEELFHLKL